MSYCRWSDDSGQCDVYVYENVAGSWTCHVATWRGDREQQIALADIAPKHAGMNYDRATPGDMAVLLAEIRAAGLNVPQDAIEELQREHVRT